MFVILNPSAPVNLGEALHRMVYGPKRRASAQGKLREESYKIRQLEIIDSSATASE